MKMDIMETKGSRKVHARALRIDWTNVKPFGVKIIHRFRPRSAHPPDFRLETPPRLRILAVSR